MKRLLALSAAGVLLLAATAIVPAGCARLIYNATDSAPTGWYWLQPGGPYLGDDEVLVELPDAPARLAADRRYLPAGLPLLKRVGARGGQRVCVRDGLVFIDGQSIATALSHDSSGRPLLAWTGCRLLLISELFLLNPARTASFDSRYFGPVSISRVRGRAIPLWTWESP